LTREADASVNLTGEKILGYIQNIYKAKRNTFPSVDLLLYTAVIFE